MCRCGDMQHMRAYNDRNSRKPEDGELYCSFRTGSSRRLSVMRDGTGGSPVIGSSIVVMRDDELIGEGSEGRKALRARGTGLWKHWSSKGG